MTSTPCPDEDTYARFLQGILPRERVAEIERHIDTCARCAELGAQFGKLYGAEGAGPDEPTIAARSRPPDWLIVAELLMVALHAVAAVVLLPAALRLAAAGAASAATLAAVYATVWVPLGGLVAAIAAWGLWRRRGWGATFARAHAITSIPSVVLAPLAAFVLQQTGTLNRGKRG